MLGRGLYVTAEKFLGLGLTEREKEIRDTKIDLVKAVDHVCGTAFSRVFEDSLRDAITAEYTAAHEMLVELQEQKFAYKLLGVQVQFDYVTIEQAMKMIPRTKLGEICGGPSYGVRSRFEHRERLHRFLGSY